MNFATLGVQFGRGSIFPNRLFGFHVEAQTLLKKILKNSEVSGERSM